MASFSRIMKFASLLLPLAAALPTTDVAAPEFNLPDGMTVAEAMKLHVPRSSGCANDNGGVHIIAARGSTEPPGQGALGELSSILEQNMPGSDSMGIDYPATLYNYQSSVNQGTESMNQAIASYVEQCPKSRILLMGYSQGAQVVMNTLCGTNELSFTPTKRLDKKYWHHIAAVLIYADPSHLAGKIYDRGTSTLNGMFPRQKSGLCAPFRKRIVSYCDYNDPVCASGYDENVHLTYFNKYNNDAAQWLTHKTKAHFPWDHKNNQ